MPCMPTPVAGQPQVGVVLAPSSPTASAAGSGAGAAAPLAAAVDGSGPWRCVQTATGRPFYFNEATRVGQWAAPSAMATMNAAVVAQLAAANAPTPGAGNAARVTAASTTDTAAASGGVTDIAGASAQSCGVMIKLGHGGAASTTAVSGYVTVAPPGVTAART